ncbi:hypothetical protein [Streptomyces sp. NEAU-NA10]|uniref:hypothetical protein n=1 Tax=Streptomyces sp. NEAU-NA10 TaxID=3416050 RepID=UPI003CC5DB78
MEELLAAALRTGTATDADEGERRAVAAFRAARDSGAHQARTRRRDDWRPRGQRHASRSLKATLSVLVASLALGGVAVAAIGSAGSSTDARDDGGRPRQSASAPDASGTSQAAGSGTASTSPSDSASADRDRPVNAQDVEAHCRAYEQVKGRGKALDSTAWQRLVTAAGGEENVTAFCAAQTASASAAPSSGSSGAPSAGNGQDKGGKTGENSGDGNGQQKPETEKTPEAKGKNQ